MKEIKGRNMKQKLVASLFAYFVLLFFSSYLLLLLMDSTVRGKTAFREVDRRGDGGGGGT